MKKKIFILILATVLILTSTYLYIIYGGGRNLANEKAEFTLTTLEFSEKYKKDVSAANTKYLEKAISISGKIVSVIDDQLLLENDIVCSFTKLKTTLKVGDNTTIKGRVVGYDDLMGEIKLDQCIIKENQ